MNIAKLSVLRPIAMGMVICLILILGIVSLRNLSVDLFPELVRLLASPSIKVQLSSYECLLRLVQSKDAQNHLQQPQRRLYFAVLLLFRFVF